MQSIAIVYPNRYPIKVEDFFITITFLKNVTNLPEYLLLIAVRTGFEPVTFAVTVRYCNQLY